MNMYKNLTVLLISIMLVQTLTAQRYGESDDFSYALKLYNEGFYDIAAQQFNLFVDRYPGSERVPEAKYYLGQSFFQAEDFEKARLEFQSMAVTFPDHSRAPQAWQKVGDSYLRLEKWFEAARAYETVKILYPRDALAPGCLFKAAEIYYQQDNLDKAEVTLTDFLDRYPDSNNYPNGRLLYANLLLRKQDYDQALKEYDKALKAGAEGYLQAEAYLGLGQFYGHLGQQERAKEQYETILSKFPNEPAAFEALLSYSNLLALEENYDAALKILNDNLQRYKAQYEKAQLNLQLAAVYYLQDNYFSARKTVESIKTISLPDSLQAKLLFYMGNVYQRDQKFSESAEKFSEFINSDELKTPGKIYLPEAEKQLGYTYLAQKQFESGWSKLEQYISKYPEDPSTARILSDVFEAALRLNRPADADKVYRKLLSEKAGYVHRDEMLFSLGKFYFGKADYEKAKNVFQEFRTNYQCSAKTDSAARYLYLINKFYLVDQKTGMNKLANLVGRVLADDNAQNLKLDLARVYLLNLNEMQQAIDMSKAITAGQADSNMTAEALHIIAEGYRRMAELQRFENTDDKQARKQGLDAFKQAMNYVNHVNHPDSLAYAFISESIEVEKIPVDKRIEFWEFFVSSYSGSYLADKAAYRLANLYFDNGKADSALVKLEKLKESPDTRLAGRAYYLTGMIYYDQKKYEQSGVILKDFLLNISEHPLRANAFGLLAKIFEKEGDYKVAAQFWTRLRQDYDYSPAAIAAKTRIPEVYLIAGEYQDAIRYTRPVLREISSDDLLLRKLQPIPEPEFYFYNGKAHFHLEDYQTARKVLLTYLLNPAPGKNQEEALMLLADISLAEGDPDAALLHLQIVVKSESSPFFLQATAKMADIYLEQGEYSAAQKLYAKLLAKEPGSDEAIHYQAKEMICMINLGSFKSYDSRKSVFRKKYKKHSEYNNYMASFEFELGKYHYQKQNYDSAIKKFEKVTRSYKKSDYADDADYYMALTYTTLNKVDKAMDILSKFAEKYPDSPLKPNIYVSLGNLYYRAEKRELAVGSFQKAVETATTPETRKLALSNLILIYRDLGLWDGVLTQARVYVQEFPKADDIIDKKIIMGSAMIQLNRYSEAVDFLTNLKFEANSEQEPEIQFYIGEAYFNAGQYENAIREFVKIPLLSKQTKLQWEASALYYSAQAYEKMGRMSDAIRMYQEIVDRPGILVELKKEAQKRINRLKDSG
jgi:tol-pal system protein YbgF